MKKAWLLTSLIPFTLFAAPPPSSWNITISGNWSVAGNWSTGTVPNAQDQLITIGAPAPTVNPMTITQDVAPTVLLSQISFVSPNANAVVIAGTNSITMSTTTSPAIINTNAGTLNANTISAPIVLASNLQVSVGNAGFPITLSGIISGAFSVTTVGPGTTILSGANTFSNGVIVQSGTLQCNAATTLPAASSVTMTGGTLNLNNNAQTIGGLTGTAPITLGTATLTVNTTAANSYGGAISGAGGLSVGGSGSLTLTAANGYTGGTTVTGGTLQSGVNNALPLNGNVNLTGGVLDLNNFNQSVGNLAGTAGGSLTLGTGQLTVNLNAGTNFSGVISGSGPVVFNGNGFIWTLGTAQTYTGLTTINNGTIQLGVANALPANGPVTLAGTGILDLNNLQQTTGTLTSAAGAQVTLGTGELVVTPTASANFAGVISGLGTVTYQGPFVWTMQTAQTFTGGLTINGGTVQMGTPNCLDSTLPVTINSPGILLMSNNPLAIGSLAGNGSVDLGTGALTLNTTTTTTYSGNIVGTGGSLVIQGSGTQILNGTNSYTGGTLVTATATLQGTTASLPGAIVNNSTLYYNQSFNGSIAGPLSGNGLLQIGGGGTITLASNAIQGSVDIQQGEFDVASGVILQANNVTIDSGATLGGTGAVNSPVAAQGIINPGFGLTLGTLTVNGPVTFQAGSSYEANLTPTSSDVLAVSGLVTIQPGSQIVVHAIRGEYEEETRYAVITSTLPVAGQFDTILQMNPFLDTEIIYNQLLPGSVEVDIQIKNIADVIKGGNAGAIAKCITQAHMRADHDLESIIADMIFGTEEQFRNQLEQMQPSSLRTLTLVEEENTLFAQQLLNWRMAEFERSTCEREIAKERSANFWVSLAGNRTDQRQADHNVGYWAPAAGLMVGFDGRIAENLYLGVAVEYGHTYLHWKRNRGSSTINRVTGGPYMSYIGRFAYLNTSIIGSFANLDTDRRIPFLDRTASSEHHGETLLPHLEAGLLFRPAPDVTLSPFGMVDYLFGWEEGYQETGAESLNFTIASSSSRMFRSELGLKISKCAKRSHTKWVHDLKASWVHEDRLHGEDLTATFRQFPCTFTVKGLFPSRNFIDAGMGLTFIFKHDHSSASLRYEGQFGEGSTIQSIIGQLQTRF